LVTAARRRSVRPGNNGGDGFVVAVALAQAGWPVRVALLAAQGRPARRRRIHAARWSGAIESVTPEVIEGAASGRRRPVWVRPRRQIGSPIIDTLNAVTQRGSPLIAVDVPSGVMGDTGARA